MFIFASSITKPDVYEAAAAPGIRRAAEPDSLIWPVEAPGSLFDSYNRILDRAADVDGLEALVLLHHDTEIVSDDFCAVVREALADPQVGLVGCIGAVGVRTIAYWDASVTQASFKQRYQEHGGGELPGSSWSAEDSHASTRFGEVDSLDGFLLVLSPWVVKNLRFDASLGQLHGYDFDFCLQVREAGRKVVTADFRAIHHHSLDLISSPETWIRAHMQIAEKWEERMPRIGWEPGSFEERARVAAAERDLFQAQAVASERRAIMQVRYLTEALAGARASISWKITGPIRALERLGGKRS